jgi:hypothetical protein
MKVSEVLLIPKLNSVVSRLLCEGLPTNDEKHLQNVCVDHAVSVINAYR